MNGETLAPAAGSLSIDALAARLVTTGIVPRERVLDGTFKISDVSRRNRNHRATWAEDEGVLVKQPGPTAFATESTLRNEIAFYAACARGSSAHGLPLVDLVYGTDTPTLLILRLATKASPLWEWRRNAGEPESVYASLGRGLAALHVHCASGNFSADRYAKSLPAPSAPWVTVLHKPRTEMLQTCSPAQLDSVRIIQRDTNLGAHLETVAAALKPTHLIHADMKADNVLVENDTKIFVVDWELAQRGDPAWDVGAVLADTLEHWLLALAPKQGNDAAAIVANAAEPTRFAHGASLAFWTSYRAESALDDRGSEELLSRSILCSAAKLVQHAFEDGQGRHAISNHAVSLLQVAVNLFAAPAEGGAVLFGLKANWA